MVSSFHALGSCCGGGAYVTMREMDFTIVCIPGVHVHDSVEVLASSSFSSILAV